MNIKEKLETIVRENLGDFFAHPDSTTQVWIYADGRVRRASWDESWDGTEPEPVILDCWPLPQDEESGEYYGPDHEAFGDLEIREAVAEITTAIIEAIGDDAAVWAESLGVTA